MRKGIIILAFVIFSLGIAGAAQPSVSLDSPVNGTTYTDPDVPLNFTFSTEDTGRIYYDFNSGGNVSVSYTIGDSEVMGMTPNNSAVTGLYADNAGRLFASLQSGSIKVYDIDTLSVLGTLNGDGSAFLSVYGDGQFVFGSTQSGRVGIWNPPSTTPVANLQISSEAINRVNADDDYIYAASSDSFVYVYDKSGNPIANLTDGTSEMLDVYADEQYIYGASNDSNVYVWNINTFALVTTLSDATEGVTAVRSSGDYIQAGSLDNTVYVWNKGDFSLKGADGNVFGDMYQFDKDGDYLLVADSYGDVTVYMMNGTFSQYAVGNASVGNNLAVYSDNSYIYTGSDNGFIERKPKSYDSVVLPTVEGVNTLDLFVYNNREEMASNSSTFTVDVPFPEITVTQPVEGFTYNHSFRDLSWSHNVPSVSWGGYSLNGEANVTFHSLFPPNLVSHIASAWEAYDIDSDDNYFYVADRANSRVNVFNKTDLGFITHLDNGDSKFNLAVEEYKNFVYEAGFDCRVSIYDKNNWTLAETLDDGVEGLNCGYFALHQDGEKLYAGQELNGAGRFFVWNLTSNEQLFNLTLNGIPFAVDTDSNFVYVADINETTSFGTIRRLNKTDFVQNRIYSSQEAGNINDLHVDDDGIYLAKAGPTGNDGVIYVFNKETGIFSKIVSEADIGGIYVDRDFIYSTGSTESMEDYNLRIWDKDNLNLMHTISDPANPVKAVFSDRDYLYVGTGGPGFGGLYVYYSINPIQDFRAREGSNTITLYLNDTFGNMNSTTINFEVDTELLFNPTMLDNNHSNFLFEFTLLNNYLRDGYFNWSVDFGDGFVLDSSEDVYLEENEDVVVIAGHTYAAPGQYTITSYASNGTVSDMKSGMVNTV